MPYIPIVDCSLAETKDGKPAPLLESTAQEIVAALQEVGFVYLRNHGIEEIEIAKVFEVSKEFFALDTEIKTKYNRSTCGNQEHGYVPVGVEKLDPLWKYDEIRESFNVTSNEGLPFPTEIHDFREVVGNFFNTSAGLAARLLRLIGIGLRLEDPSFLVKCHNEMTGPTNNTTLRLLHYPPLVQKENVIRCGEHSDYGSITLLFQGAVGGLQVKHRDGSYVDATPIDGCILVNVGDLLERWTADRLVSTRSLAAEWRLGHVCGLTTDIGKLSMCQAERRTWRQEYYVSKLEESLHRFESRLHRHNEAKHRVLVPNCESLQKKDRYSIALFVHPDKNAIVECLDKSSKYPSISADDYLTQRLEATYTTE